MSRLIFHCSAFLILAAGANLFADTPQPAATPAPAAGKYELKNKSSFNLPANMRSPFWPIGWAKGTVQKEQHHAEPIFKLSSDQFIVTSILIVAGSPSLAVINGRSYEEGQLIRFPKGSAPLKVRVARIADGQVTLQGEGQTIVCPLRRGEISPRSPEELLPMEEDR